MHLRTARLLLWLIVLSPATLSAQSGSVAGTVRAEGSPLSGVLIEGWSRETVRARVISEADGRYQLTLDPGEYALVFSAPGHSPRRIEAVRITSGGTVMVDAELEVEPITLEQFVVSVSRRREMALDAPLPVTVVDERRIRERSAVAALDRVMGLAGVDLAVQGLQGRQVVARGFNGTLGTSLLMMSDYRVASIPYLRANLSHYITPTADDLDRVEVVRGPGSALYGPNAADGVVHFISKSPFDSPGSSVGITGGSRSLLQLTARHAQVFSDRLAVKASGHFLRGKEWSAPPRSSEIVARDPLIERVNGELRADLRLASDATAVLTIGSTLAKRHVEYIPIGTTQVKDWRYDFAQLRYTAGRLFAQAYVNMSDAGETFELQVGPKDNYDHSRVYTAQVQHGFDLAGSTVTYGADLIQTVPRTAGNVMGRNEADDVTVETGAYVQAERRITDQLQLVAAARIDRHNRMHGAVWSPRIGFVYSLDPTHRLRAAYNRAFSNPTATDLFVDIVAARLTPLPYDIRAVGVPKDGFRFASDCDGLCMASPFASGQRLPLDATRLWPAVVQVMRAYGADLSSIPAPTATQVPTVLRTLDPGAGVFRTYSGTPRDIEPLEPTITNSFEVAYTGLLAQRLLLNVSVYAMRRRNFRGPLAVETPNAFLDTNALAGYLGRFMPSAQAGALAVAIGGLDASQQAPGIPLGTVGPDHALAGSDIVLTYRNFGNISLWGTDLSAEWAPSSRFTAAGTYSYTSENYFAPRRAGETALALNAPRHKVAVNALWREPGAELTAELRARHVSAFPMVDGIWVGDVAAFTVADIEVGRGLPGVPGARLTLTVQNVFNDRHAEFVMAPVLGRLFLSRLEYRF